MTSQFDDHQLTDVLDTLDSSVPPPDEQKLLAARRAFLQRADELRTCQECSRQPFWSRMFRPAVAFAGVLIAIALLGTGVASAADNALPGDALYDLDLAIERMQLNLAASPQQSITLQLAQAFERLEEANIIAGQGDLENAQVALKAYGGAIAGTAQTIGTAPDRDRAGLSALLKSALSDHNQQLESLLTHLPEQGQPEIEHALEAAQQRRQEAMDAIEERRLDNQPHSDNTAPHDSDQPEEHGSPENSGRPESAGPPEENGKPDDTGAPDDKGRPENAGPPDDKGKPEKAGHPNGKSRNNNPGRPDHAGRPDDKIKPEKPEKTEKP